MSQSSNHHDGEHPVEATSFTATTENAAGRFSYRFGWCLLVFMCLFLGGMAIFAEHNVSENQTDDPFARSDDPWARHALATLSLTPLLSFVFLVRNFQRGSWRFDERGIEFHSIKGVQQFLAWDDIEAVKWNRYMPSFRGSSQVMRPRLQFMDESEHEASIAFIESRLCNEFDLKSPPRIRMSFKRWLAIFAIGIVYSAWFIGGLLFYILVVLPYLENLSRGCVILGILLWMFLPLFIGVWKMQRIPWRVRHQKYAILDDPST